MTQEINAIDPDCYELTKEERRHCHKEKVIGMNRDHDQQRRNEILAEFEALLEEVDQTPNTENA